MPAPRTRAGAGSAPRRRSPCPGTRATGTSVSSLASPSGLRSTIHFEHGEERLLRHLDGSDLLHTALAFLLFLQELALARDVAAITLGGDVLAQGADRLARDHLAADRRLDRDREHLPGDELL